MKKTALALAALVLLSASVQSANASCKFCQKLKFWEKKAEAKVETPVKKEEAKKVEVKPVCPCAKPVAKPAVKAPVAPAKPACPCAKPAAKPVVKAPVKK